MGLPTTGPLSINDIRIELGEAQGNNSLGDMSNTVGFPSPDAISDFYGYEQITKFYGSTSGNVKAVQACPDATPNTGILVKDLGNSSSSPEVDDIFKDGTGNVISTGTNYLPTNISSVGPPPSGLSLNIVIRTDTNGVITSVYSSCN
tara:strand:- start:720 stop:1160 length:441 start_codon:yes stop_codon:yes gene_type:complete